MKRLLPVLLTALFTTTASAVAYQRPPENRTGRVSTTQVRHDANGLARKVAAKNDARRYQVTVCRHLRRSAVDCAVRLTYVDPEDGFVTVERWVVHGIATRGGRWAEIRPAPPYATGLVLGR